MESTNVYKALMDAAEVLGSLTDTDWAEEHPGAWENFDEVIKRQYKEGKITAEQFNELATTAFYDYFDLIDVEE